MGRWLPDAESLRANPSLRWLGPLLDRPWLWRFERGGVAAGLALGLFFGLLLPLGQALFAGAGAVWLRAHLPVAVLATFVSNPFTTPAILVGAYHVGAAVLHDEATPAPGLAELPWLERIGAMGEPLLVGLLVVASCAAVAGYAAVILCWRWIQRLKARHDDGVPQ